MMQNLVNNKSLCQLFLYLIVGALATIVEWVCFYVLNARFLMHYTLATALAFVVSTFANWIFGKIILFHQKQNVAKELLKIYLTSIIGLLLNMLIMFVAIEKLGLVEMLSKIIATGIVFMWNFLVRKCIIYKE